MDIIASAAPEVAYRLVPAATAAVGALHHHPTWSTR